MLESSRGLPISYNYTIRQERMGNEAFTRRVCTIEKCYQCTFNITIVPIPLKVIMAERSPTDDQRSRVVSFQTTAWGPLDSRAEYSGESCSGLLNMRPFCFCACLPNPFESFEAAVVDLDIPL